MIEHLSPSTVQSYRNCGKQVYFNKILGVVNPTKYAMTAYGTAMHYAIEMLYGGKLSKEDYIKQFQMKWEDLSEEVNTWKNDTKDHLMEQGIKACEDFYDNVYGKYDVVETEKEFVIYRGEKNFPVLCYADAITSKGEIIDYKFGHGLTGTANSLSYACNMATYAWAYKEYEGELPKKIVFIKQKWLKKKDKETGKFMYYHGEFVIEEKEITEKDIDFYKQVYECVEKGVQNNIWLPASDESLFCKGCGYRLNGYCDKSVV